MDKPVEPNFCCVLIMGVAGAGKSSVGSKLAKKIGGYFLEADSFHSAENIAKMKTGIPLNDNDRFDWLLHIKAKIVERRNEQNVVIACSALKKKYRDLIDIDKCQLVYLKIDRETAARRIKNRENHFMPVSLVESQFGVLEEPLDALTYLPHHSVEEIVNSIIEHLG